MAERQLEGKEMLLFREKAGFFAIDSITVENAGSGYDNAPTVTINSATGSGAVLQAVMAGSGSSQTVASVTVVQGGSGYTSSDTVVFTGGTPATSAVATAVLATEPDYQAVVCLQDHSLDQSSNTVTADTFCGKISLSGTQDAKFTCNVAVTLSPESGKVSIDTLQNDYKSGEYVNWKITKTSPISGDMVWTFRAYVESANFKADSTGLYQGSFSMQIDKNGADLDIVA